MSRIVFHIKDNPSLLCFREVLIMYRILRLLVCPMHLFLYFFCWYNSLLIPHKEAEVSYLKPNFVRDFSFTVYDAQNSVPKYLFIPSCIHMQCFQKLKWWSGSATKEQHGQYSTTTTIFQLPWMHQWCWEFWVTDLSCSSPCMIAINPVLIPDTTSPSSHSLTL